MGQQYNQKKGAICDMIDTYFTCGIATEKEFIAIMTAFRHNEDEKIEDYVNRILEKYGLQVKGHTGEGYFNYDYFRVGKIGQEINPYPGGFGPTITPLSGGSRYHTNVTNDEFAKQLNRYIDTHSKARSE